MFEGTNHHVGMTVGFAPQAHNYHFETPISKTNQTHITTLTFSLQS
jgi:hypothetical protein